MPPSVVDLDALPGELDVPQLAELLAELSGLGLALSEDPEQIRADIEALAKKDEGVDDLPTVDFTGRNAVTIMAEGGPYFGTGSPKGGSFFDETYLKERADHTNEAIAAGELRSRVKLGHNERQKLLKDAGLFGEDGRPAAGVLHNFRVVGATGKKRLVADAKKVPKKLAAMIKAGSWPGRSVELRNIEGTTPATKGKKWRVIDALALLGEKAPAIRTLGDWLAYFGEDESEYQGAEVQILLLAAGDVVWKPDESYEAIRSKISGALNPGPGYGMSRYWVRDIADGKALVKEYGDPGKTWVVPYEIDDTGDVTVSAATDWVEAEEAWVEASTALAERVDEFRADSSGVMPEATTTTKLSDEAVVKLATTFGIDEADDAKRREAVEAKLAEVQEAVPAPVAETTPTTETTTPPAVAPTTDAPQGVTLSEAEVETLRTKAERGEQAFEDARIARRDTALTKAMDEGRLDPAKLEKWQGFFDENEANTIELLAELPVDPELLAVRGIDDTGNSTQEAERTLGDSWMAFSGIDDSDLYGRKAA